MAHQLDCGQGREALAKCLTKFPGSSLLIADQGWGQLLAHGVGLDFLTSLGVVGVVGIEDAGGVSLGFDQAIVLCSRLLLDPGVAADLRRVFRSLRTAETRVIVVTNVSEACHRDADPEKYAGGFEGIHGHLVALPDDMSGAFVDRVLDVNYPCMVFGKNAFAFPSRSGASFLDFRRGPQGGEEDLQGKLALNAHLLSSVSKMMDVQPEAFCVGPLSERVGNVLAFVPAHDSSRNARAAFCIVDRSLDTATSSQHSDYFIQQMFCSVGIDHVDGDAEGDHYGDDGDTAVDELRPSLFHPGDVGTSSGYVEFLTSKSQREAALFVRKWLKESIRQSSLKFTGRLKPGAVSAEDIEALCQVLLDDPAARVRHASLIQISSIVCQCLRGGSAWDELAKGEQIARLSAEDGPDSLSGLILDELDASRRGLIPVFDVVRHLMMGSYWMKMGCGGARSPGPTDGRDHSADQFTAPSVPLSGTYALPTVMIPDAQRAAIAEALAAASCARRGQEELPWIPEHASEDSDLLEFSTIAVETVCSLPAHPGVASMVDDILHKRPIPTMKHIGTSIAGLLKSGLGRIGLQHHSPGEYETIVIFILGGISAAEMADIRAVVDRSGTPARVVVGGSSICAEPALTLRSVFAE